MLIHSTAGNQLFGFDFDLKFTQTIRLNFNMLFGNATGPAANVAIDLWYCSFLIFAVCAFFAPLPSIFLSLDVLPVVTNLSTSSSERHLVLPSGDMYVVSFDPAILPVVLTVVMAVHPIGKDILARFPLPLEACSALRFNVACNSAVTSAISLSIASYLYFILCSSVRLFLHK